MWLWTRIAAPAPCRAKADFCYAGAMNPSFRRDRLPGPIFRWAQRVLPSLSATEREAIEAGDVWWDADLFSGNPDWGKLLATPPAQLSAEGHAFLVAPVEQQ